MTYGVLESIQAQLARIEAKLESAIRSTEPLPAPQSNPSIWSDGALDLAAAEKTFTISRRELYALMRSGELPYAVATRERLVPRKWLVAYLERKQHRAEDVR